LLTSTSTGPSWRATAPTMSATAFDCETSAATAIARPPDLVIASTTDAASFARSR